MQQDLLDGAASQLTARFEPTFDGWRRIARTLLANDRRPADVWWAPDHDSTAPDNDTATMKVPRRFVDSARLVACHRSEDRWALLYEIAWRLTHGEPHLMSVAGDPAVVRMHRYEKAVRRDHHKMKAFLRFRQTVDDDGRERFVAWFEPDHYIVDLAAIFFRRRFANMKWSILTPYRSAHWEGSGEVWFSAGADRQRAPAHDRFETAWQSYYRSTFNPARVKVQAMQSEMPQKYWRNLPEAQEITRLLSAADDRMATMLDAPASDPSLHCGERPASYEKNVQAAASNGDGWARLAADLETCSACDHCPRATQVVMGEGNRRARVMLVGEQPGDLEDLEGRPFIGPAGKVLDEALQAIGVDRSMLYLTNAVKHFRYRPAGKRRLHEKPREGDIHSCRPFLTREIEMVKPEVVICLGRTAASAVLGTGFNKDVKLSSVRGQRFAMDGFETIVTAHPSSVLRSGAGRQQAFHALVRDLSLAVKESR